MRHVTHDTTVQCSVVVHNRHGHYGFYEVKAIAKAIIGQKIGPVNGQGNFFSSKISEVNY